MANHFDVLAISSGGDMLDRVGIEAAVDVRKVHMTRKITPFTDLKALVHLVFLMHMEKPTIVHTHTPKAGLLGMMAAKIVGVPVRLHTVAGLPLLERKGLIKWILVKMEQLTCYCATGVYPNSKGIMQIILKNKFCKKGKLKVIGEGSTSGIDTSFFNPSLFDGSETTQTYRQSLQIGEDNFVYCFIGRMVGDKGIAELVTAFCNLYRQFPNLILLMVGPFEPELDPLDKEIIKLIKAHPGIRWIDFQKDVRPFLAISDVFVFPSYREGFPNVVMQAGAMNLPCIVSDINGCNEIIEENINGVIIPIKNVQALQQAMNSLFVDHKTCKAMASVSRQLIVRRFESNALIEEILKEYHLQIAKQTMV